MKEYYNRFIDYHRKAFKYKKDLQVMSQMGIFTGY